MLIPCLRDAAAALAGSLAEGDELLERALVSAIATPEDCEHYLSPYDWLLTVMRKMARRF